MSDTNPNNPLRWHAEDDNSELCSKLRDKLQEVVDPEIGLSIIQLGLVRDVKIEADSASIRMILTTPFCPYAGTMLEMTRLKAEEALGRPTTVDLDFEPWDSSMMDEDAREDWGLLYP